MLTNLFIQNYILIDEVNIAFQPGLNIITGETGAGKSIILGALGLILGGKGEAGALMDKSKKTIAEATFEVADKPHISDFLQQNDFESSDTLTVRREITSSGKSRAFINDTPTGQQQLKGLGNNLIDLHQQFDTHDLADNNFQREVIDALANNKAALAEYQPKYKVWVQAKKDWLILVEQKASFDKEADYNTYLYQELVDFNLKENELEELEKELKLMSHSESIKTALDKVIFELTENDPAVNVTLKQHANLLQAQSAYLPSLSSLAERMTSVQVELDDIAHETMSINQNINFDSQLIDEINQRISTGYKLFKKHGAKSSNELIEKRMELHQKIQTTLRIDEEIIEKEKISKKLEKELLERGAEITVARKQGIEFFEKEVNLLLAKVGMPNARVKADLKAGQPGPYGCDDVVFLFDANKSNRFESIGKVASGGELSRLMLCIKSLVAKNIDLPTMIFDEIDTGISGEAAKQVANIMSDLSQSRQVICITHQPQMAAKGAAHFYVYKQNIGEKLFTNIRPLSKEERVMSIAQMIGGHTPSPAALESAKEMVEGIL